MSQAASSPASVRSQPVECLTSQDWRRKHIRKNGACLKCADEPLTQLLLPSARVSLESPERVSNPTDVRMRSHPGEEAMRIRAALIIGALLAMISPGLVFGQGFQGGLRGAVKDSGGVIPGVEVTLTNERTNISRSTVTNERGEYVFVNVDPGTYKLKAVLQGYKTVEQPRDPHRHAAVPDAGLRAGGRRESQESITVTASGAAHRNLERLAGHRPRHAGAADAARARPQRVLHRHDVPTVIPTGDPQFIRQQDQTNSSLLSLGGGPRRGNNYTLDGVPITDIRNRASANPSIEAVEDVKVQVHTYDAEMGAHRRRRVQHDAEVGHEQPGTAPAFYQTRPDLGHRRTITSRQKALDGAGDWCASRNEKPDSPYIPRRRRHRRPDREEQDVLLVRDRGLHDPDPQRVRAACRRRPSARGDFSGTTKRRKPVIIYDPLTQPPFPGNIIPANRINPVAAAMLKYLPMPDINLDNGTPNYNADVADQQRVQQEYTVKVEHKFTDKVSLTGFYLYNRTNEPCANYFGTADRTDPNRFADPLDYILTAGRRSSRSTTHGC